MNPENFPLMPQGPKVPPAGDENETEDVPQGPEIVTPPDNVEIPSQEGPEVITNPDIEPPAETPEHTLESSQQKENNEQAAELQLGRIKLENLLDSARGLIGTLREREHERWNPLIEENELSRISAAIHDGEELIEAKTASYEEFENVIAKMTRAIEQIGQAPRQRNAKDDLESLGKVVARLRRIRDEIHEIGVSVTQTEGRPQRTLNALKNLEEILDEKQLFVRRLHRGLSEYMGR